MSIFFTRLLVVISAFLVAAGWVLSALRELNRAGYTVALALMLALIVALHRQGIFGHFQLPHFSRVRARFRRFFPLAFLGIAALVLLGALIHPTNNWDALAYRVPRTLHWLAAGEWHWIHTDFHRMNTRAQGVEWMMAPVLLFLRSEEPMWGQNFAMFLLMPGLIFATFSRAGVRRRVAWAWMWLLPTGGVFVLQAGGIANDLPGVFFTLAAVALALLAVETRRISDLWLSMLAMALATGLKASNAPLGLVWLAAAFPAWRLLAARPAGTAAVALVSLGVSFLPGAVLNARFCGDWSGTKLELASLHGAPAWVMISGNAINLATQNFAPPVLPGAARLSEKASALVPGALREKMREGFEGRGIDLPEMQIEELAGLGLGISTLLLLAAVSAARAGKGRARSRRLLAVQWSPWVALLVFAAKLGIANSGRVAAPFYPLLAIAILAACPQEFVRRAWWRLLAGAQFLSAAALVILSPSRPLWPALTVLDRLEQRNVVSPTLRSLRDVYFVHSIRHDAMAPVRDALPPELRVAGLVTGDDLETSFWRPFGSRCFFHVTGSDTPDSLARRGIEYIAVSQDAFASQMKQPFPDWLESMHATLLQTLHVHARSSRGSGQWHIVRLQPPSFPPPVFGTRP